jgi:chromosome partitioning protein
MDQVPVIAIAINKGGVGKTTTTKNLATAATLAGYLVLVLDVDTQENSSKWGKRRGDQQTDKELPLTKFTTENGLKGEIERGKTAGCDLIFIDTPPGKSAEALAAIDEADMTLIPFQPDIDSYEGVAMTAKVARRLGKPAYGILNFAHPNSRVHEETARAVLKEIDLPFVPVVMYRYDAHRIANLRGLTAQELEPDGHAAMDIERLWTWLHAHLQLGTRAQSNERGAA